MSRAVILLAVLLFAAVPARAQDAAPGPYASLLTDAMSSLYPLRSADRGWMVSGHGDAIVEGCVTAGYLMAAFRRSSRGSEPVGMRDGELRIPEHHNRLPDVLDEVRSELDWLLTQRVPEGQPLAGMIAENGTPSAAATLDFAAVAAAGSRYFGRFDRAYVNRLKAAAREAYAAAIAAPGGDAADLADERYWAAAELFVTTGDKAFLADLRASPLWSGTVFGATAYDDGNVAPFARLLLAREPTRLPSADAAAIRQSIEDDADRLLARPVSISASKDWPTLYARANDALLLAAAYDISGHDVYRDAAIALADSILASHERTALIAANQLSPRWNGALSQLAGWLNEQ